MDQHHASKKAPLRVRMMSNGNHHHTQQQNQHLWTRKRKEKRQSSWLESYYLLLVVVSVFLLILGVARSYSYFRSRSQHSSDASSIPTTNNINNHWEPYIQNVNNIEWCQVDPSGNVTHRVPDTTGGNRILKLRSFAGGEPLDTNNNNVHDSLAICELFVDKNSGHFPHAMQQLYQCWSYWNTCENSGKEPVLKIPKQAPGFSSSSWTRWLSRGLLLGNAGTTDSVGFLTGFVQALTEAANVTVLRGNENDDARYKNAPSVQRADRANTFVMQSPSHARALTSRIVQYYNLTATKTTTSWSRKTLADAGAEHQNSSHQPCGRRRPRIAILNRTPHSSRSLLNVHALVDALSTSVSSLSNDSSIKVATFEGTSFLDQVKFFANVDIVLSPHGAQLTLLPFLPECGRLLEIFPAHYYFDLFFGSLADAAGIDLYTLYLSHGNPQDEWRRTHDVLTPTQRNAVRNVALCPPVAAIVTAMKQMVMDWQTCCHQKNVQ